MVVGRRVALRADRPLENGNRRIGGMVVDRCSIRLDHEEAHRDRREDENRSLRREDGWVVGGGRRSRDDCGRTWRWVRMVVQMVKGLREHSDPGKLARLVQGENRRCGNLDRWGRSLDSLTTWPESSHCGSHLLEAVVIHVGEVVEVSADDSREEEILLVVVSEDGVVGIGRDKLAELLVLPDVILHRRGSEVEIHLAIYLDVFDARSHGMTLATGPEIYLLSGAMVNGSVLLELADSCHPLVGFEKRNRVMGNNHVSHTVPAVVKQAFHDRANVAAGYRQVRLVSLAGVNEVWPGEIWNNGELWEGIWRSYLSAGKRFEVEVILV